MSSLSQIANELSYDIDPSHTSDPMIVLEDDSGADYDDDTDSTHTIDSEHSVHHYRDFHGRMYYSNISAFGDARYWEPVDRKHLDALDLKMFWTLVPEQAVGQCNYDPLRLIAGIQYQLTLNRDVAEKFPAASVIGIDIVPVQYDWVPPNVRFEIDSCTLKWTFKEGRFDYIHIRDLAGSITDWQRLCSEAYKCLKPGGILESSEASKRFEYTGSLSRGLERWYNLFIEAGNKTGRSFSVVEENVLRTTMKEVGFVDVHSESYKVVQCQAQLVIFN
ncbi:methyltransferase domain-containing protein [Colletotrichum asianum]|uniref:Methyltransferase domain-containing protein n=1 Tax=Colletotrichum asianum TaxID=702518 RepID=A0A8H3ZYF9_9PEZI|nr:methyltransferase domain-containing protein [Colletotrichum asianum]